MDEKKATNTIARFSQSRDSATYPYAQSLSFTIGKTVIFNPVVWVEVWFWVKGTCLFPRRLCYLPGHIFRFFVSCTGPEEIVPVCTRGSERNNNNNNKTTMPRGESLQITNFVRDFLLSLTAQGFARKKKFFLRSRSNFFWARFIKFPDFFFFLPGFFFFFNFSLLIHELCS